ncbi:MAG: hypothetical protein F6J87_16570 [Spirulina sp. SIO3F2]|nr:hypothetical protein [Spirulina sp. SIO3F2]
MDAEELRFYRDVQFYIDVAVDLIGQRDRRTISHLKDFLHALPSLQQIEQVLGTAIIHLAATQLTLFDWAIDNQDVFAPELDLLSFTKQLAITRLSEHNWIHGQDFHWESERILVITPVMQEHLSNCYRPGELWLLRTLLEIRL